MFDRKVELLQVIGSKIYDKTARFLDNGGDIPQMTVIFDGVTVNIPMTIPETNNLAQAFIEDIIAELRDYI